MLGNWDADQCCGGSAAIAPVGLFTGSNLRAHHWLHVPGGCKYDPARCRGWFSRAARALLDFQSLALRLETRLR
jgi:hypothetical protein